MFEVSWVGHLAHHFVDIDDTVIVANKHVVAGRFDVEVHDLTLLSSHDLRLQGELPVTETVDIKLPFGSPYEDVVCNRVIVQTSKLVVQEDL